MIDESVVAAIHARLAAALAAPVERYRPLRVERETVGWIDDARAAHLARYDDVFAVGDSEIAFQAALRTADQRTAAADRVCRALSEKGLLTAWRNERYAVATGFGERPLFLLERAAARFFGIRTYAAHVNGLVKDGENAQTWSMWLARRSPTKSIDPNLLDNLVGGGIAAGSTVSDTLTKETWEEAGIDVALAQTAVAAGAVHICRPQPDGLHRETVFVHDLFLAPDVKPAGQDGEVAEHRLVRLDEAARIIANAKGSDVVTADASLVIADCLLRHGAIAPDAGDYLALEALRHASMEPANRRS